MAFVYFTYDKPLLAACVQGHGHGVGLPRFPHGYVSIIWNVVWYQSDVLINI